MKRRSIKYSYLFGAAAILCAVMVFYTSLLGPIEGTLLDVAERILLHFKTFSGESRELSLPNGDEKKFHVIEKRSDEFRDVLIIDKKALVNQKVISGDVFVGVVMSSGDFSSKVRLITSPGFKIDGVSERAGIPLSLEGKGASLLAAKVPRGSDISEGDIITHNEGNALVIGAVRKIIDVPSDPFLTVIVLHPINFTTFASGELL